MMKRLLLILMLLCFSQTTTAHKMKTVFSIVLFNERSGYLEVMHRFVLHDAEEAVWQLFDKQADIIGSKKTQAQLAQYATEQFALIDQAGKPLKLDLVGFQIDAGHFWVYQDIKLPKNLNKLNVEQNAFREIWAEQINVVNVEKSEKVWSLSFSGNDQQQSISLHPND